MKRLYLPLAGILTALLFSSCADSLNERFELSDKLTTESENVTISDDSTADSSSSSSATVSWYTGTLSNSSSSYIIFYFYAATKGSYAIYWNDAYNGSGAFTADVIVSAGTYAGDTTYFAASDSAYTTPKTITVSSPSYVYLKIVPYSSSSGGTFGIRAINASNGSAQTLYLCASN